VRAANQPAIAAARSCAALFLRPSGGISIRKSHVHARRWMDAITSGLPIAIAGRRLQIGSSHIQESAQDLFQMTP
jgi:hypothetical protein